MKKPTVFDLKRNNHKYHKGRTRHVKTPALKAKPASKPKLERAQYHATPFPTSPEGNEAGLARVFSGGDETSIPATEPHRLPDSQRAEENRGEWRKYSGYI